MGSSLAVPAWSQCELIFPAKVPDMACLKLVLATQAAL